MAVSSPFKPPVTPRRVFFRKAAAAKRTRMKTWRPSVRNFFFSRRTYVQSLSLSVTSGFSETELHLHNPQSLQFSNPTARSAQFNNVVVA